MVKHPQTICSLFPTNCLSVFDHFVGLALKRLTSSNAQSSLRVKKIIVLFLRLLVCLRTPMKEKTCKNNYICNFSAVNIYQQRALTCQKAGRFDLGWFRPMIKSVIRKIRNGANGSSRFFSGMGQ